MNNTFYKYDTILQGDIEIELYKSNTDPFPKDIYMKVQSADSSEVWINIQDIHESIDISLADSSPDFRNYYQSVIKNYNKS